MRKTLISAAILTTTALAGSASAETLYGVTLDNRLVAFDSSTPGTLTRNVAISGLNPNELVLGIDRRPLTGELFAMTSDSRLLSINIFDGASTPVGSGFAPALTPGVEYGFDFNPTVDRIRVVDANGGNRRLNPVTGGAVQNDTNLTYAAPTTGVPRAVATAYTNSIANAPLGSVRQFIIDSAIDALGEVGSQAGGNASFNGGVVTRIGSLGFDTNDLVGFDISADSGVAYLSLTNPSTNFTSLFTLDLSSGSASLVGAIGNGLTLRDISVIPAPGAFGLLAAAGLTLGSRRRRA